MSFRACVRSFCSVIKSKFTTEILGLPAGTSQQLSIFSGYVSPFFELTDFREALSSFVRCRHNYSLFDDEIRRKRKLKENCSVCLIISDRTQ